MGPSAVFDSGVKGNKIWWDLAWNEKRTNTAESTTIPPVIQQSTKYATYQGPRNSTVGRRQVKQYRATCWGVQQNRARQLHMQPIFCFNFWVYKLDYSGHKNEDCFLDKSLFFLSLSNGTRGTMWSLWKNGGPNIQWDQRGHSRRSWLGVILQ